MSPGRAWSALTIWRSFCFASALRTQVWTAAQPPPGILWPAWPSDHVTKLAHHGLPGPDLGRGEVLVDLGAGVDARLVDAELRLRDLQRGRPEGARARAGRRRGGRVDHARHARGRRDRGGRPGRRLGGHEQARAALLRARGVGDRRHELARLARPGRRARPRRRPARPEPRVRERRPRRRPARPGWRPPGRAGRWPRRGAARSGRGTARRGAPTSAIQSPNWFGSVTDLPLAMRCCLAASAWSRNHFTCSSGLSGKPA